MEYDKTFSFELNDNNYEALKQLKTVHNSQKYVIGLDYGNGKSIQIEGQFKAKFNALFKRIKKGKRYVFKKTKYLPINCIEFIGNKVITNER